MILQHRDSTLRCISQHDHALLSGALALAMRPALPLEMILTVSLHDLAWASHNRLGAQTPFDAERGLIHDFITLPPHDKLALYRPGHDLYESIHPYMGLLLSLHYSAFFPRAPEYEAYLETEEARQARLRAELIERKKVDARAFEEALVRDFELLKFLDIVSLYACLHAPGARVEHGPVWLRSEYRVGSESYEMSFEGDDVLWVSGWVGEDVAFDLPFRDIERRSYASAEAFTRAYEDAPAGCWSLEIRGRGLPPSA